MNRFSIIGLSFLRHSCWLLILFGSNGLFAASGTVFNVKSFGATVDSTMLATDAINDAIAAAVHAGGGTVNFPAGTYRSYSIRLQSHISLFSEQGAILMVAEPVGNIGYDAPELASNDAFQDYGYSHWHNSLIWGDNLEDISIIGTGTIYGQGVSRAAMLIQIHRHFARFAH